MKDECDYTGEYLDDETAYDEDLFDMVERKTMIKLIQMIAVERTMRMAGWLDKCVDGLSDIKFLNPIKLECVQPVRMWRAVVAAKKKELMSKRMKNLPINVANL
jgi:hypothetical protein